MSDDIDLKKRVTKLMHVLYDAMDESGENQKVVMKTALCVLIASQVRVDYPNDIDKQDKEIEACMDVIKNTLEFNGARRVS